MGHDSYVSPEMWGPRALQRIPGQYLASWGLSRSSAGPGSPTSLTALTGLPGTLDAMPLPAGHQPFYFYAPVRPMGPAWVVPAYQEPLSHDILALA